VVVESDEESVAGIKAGKFWKGCMYDRTSSRDGNLREFVVMG